MPIFSSTDLFGGAHDSKKAPQSNCHQSSVTSLYLHPLCGVILDQILELSSLSVGQLSKLETVLPQIYGIKRGFVGEADTNSLRAK